MSTTQQLTIGHPAQTQSTVLSPNLVQGLSAQTPATPAQVMRAAQKDGAMTRFIEQEVAEQIREILGNRPGRENIIDVIKQLASFLYYCCTTLSGLQTLGEEYSGILMISGNGHIPHKLIMLQMILLKCFGSTFVSFLVRNAFFRSLVGLFKHRQTKDVDTLVKDVASCLPVLNSGLFYLTGDYADIAKRITGIHYIAVHFWLKRKKSHLGFVVLGIVSLLYSLVAIIQAVQKFNTEFDLDSNVLPAVTHFKSKDRCPFCLMLRTDPAVTTCGHVFCWECIMEVLQAENKCPICRETVEQSRVVLLQNYNEQEDPSK